jgi:hypothetical protein
MKLFHRKNKWQRLMDNAATNTYKKPGVKKGAAAVAGAVTLTAASAAVSSLRRKNNS